MYLCREEFSYQTIRYASICLSISCDYTVFVSNFIMSNALTKSLYIPV